MRGSNLSAGIGDVVQVVVQSSTASGLMISRKSEFEHLAEIYKRSERSHSLGIPRTAIVHAVLPAVLSLQCFDFAQSAFPQHSGVRL